MGTQEVLAYSVAGILVVSLASLAVFGAIALALNRSLSRIMDQAETFLKQTQEELAATLQEAHLTLERVEKLAQSTDGLVRSEITPTMQVTRAALSNVERTTGVIRATAESMGRVAVVVNALTGPAGIGKALKSSSGKLGLLAVGVRAGLNAFLHNGSPRTRASAGSDRPDN